MASVVSKVFYKSIKKNNILGHGVYGNATASTSLSFSHKYSVIL